MRPLQIVHDARTMLEREEVEGREKEWAMVLD